MDFIPACFFFGEEAVAQATAEDGVEMPANPFYIRQTNDSALQILSALATEVHVIQSAEDLAFVTVPWADWFGVEGAYTPCPGEFCTVWIALNEGAITEVMEQYIP